MVLLYYIIIYPMRMLFSHVTQVNFQKWLIVSFSALTRLNVFIASVRENEDTTNKIGQRKGNGVTILFPFDEQLINDILVTIAQLLYLIDKEHTVRLYAFGSFACENAFSQIRNNVQGNHCADTAINELQRKIT